MSAKFKYLGCLDENGHPMFECQNCWVCFPTSTKLGLNVVEFGSDVVMTCPCFECSQTEITHYPDSIDDKVLVA